MHDWVHDISSFPTPMLMTLGGQSRILSGSNWLKELSKVQLQTASQDHCPEGDITLLFSVSPEVYSLAIEMLMSYFEAIQTESGILPPPPPPHLLLPVLVHTHVLHHSKCCHLTEEHLIQSPLAIHVTKGSVTKTEFELGMVDEISNTQLLDCYTLGKSFSHLRT